MANLERISGILRTKGAFWATILLCALLLACRVFAASEGARHVGHVDERHVYGTALEVIDGDDPNPGFFRYPSLPIYLTALTIVVSNGILGNEREGLSPTVLVPQRPGQTYEPERVIRHARAVFALLGGAAFFWVAFLAWWATRRLRWAWTAPLMLGVSGVVQRQVVSYHNVDAPTLFFALLTIVVAARHYEVREPPRPFHAS